MVQLLVPWLYRQTHEVDDELGNENRTKLLAAVCKLNDRQSQGDDAAFYAQQLLLSKLYELSMKIASSITGEGSVVLHQVTRLLENATIALEDARIDEVIFYEAPANPRAYITWIKELAKSHPAYKHPYYVEFIRNRADRDDLRNYVIQESVVDARFDDLLALMQVGTTGDVKMEIANNFWDEMGNGDPAQVHTHLFNQVFDVLDISQVDLDARLSSEALLSGNLAVLTSRYRRLYHEAVGYFGITEWLASDRFVHVVHAWKRLSLAAVGITYHNLHITVDARHASGWFRRVVQPAVHSPFSRKGITRGVLWRLNSSARYLDERLAEATER
jgi:hypothetical protein